MCELVNRYGYENILMDYHYEIFMPIDSFISKTQYFVWNIFNVQCIFLGKQSLCVEGLLDALNFCNISLSTSKEC